jgi:hypothetical protein
MIRVLRLLPMPLIAAGLLAACGGGDDGGTGGGGSSLAPGGDYVAGVYPAASTYADQCQSPRSGNDPSTGRPWPDRSGNALAEKSFLRSWTHNTYLWFDEVVDRDPNSVADVLEYFDLLKTTVVLPNGRDKDEFHFTYDTAEYYALSESGVSVGYGISWALLQSSPPRKLIVQFVEPGSQAATAGFERGAEILTVDGIDLINDATQSGVDGLNAALFDPAQGSTHSFVFRLRNGTQRSASLAAVPVTLDPVPVVRVLPTATGNVGYLQFNDHIATAEQKLVTAINQLQTASIRDLVLDVRYNGGGYLAIASELAYMVAGSARTSGKAFERTVFNSKHPTTNPVTGERLEPIPFLSRTQGLSGPSGQTLPSLGLSRVTVLTTGETCSASESIINSLRGIGVEVIQIGGDTCGKPYGFYPEDNCGTTYFSVQFKGVNELGFGDYAAGFSPAVRAGQPAGALLPGCLVADDYSRDLGDPEERMLKVALDYRANNRSCALAASAAPDTDRVRASQAGPGEGGLELRLPTEPWRNNRIHRQ